VHTLAQVTASEYELMLHKVYRDFTILGDKTYKRCLPQPEKHCFITVQAVPPSTRKTLFNHRTSGASLIPKHIFSSEFT